MSNLLLGLIGPLGTTETILILLVILILFGAKKIPEFAKGLGQGVREFKNAANNVKAEVKKEVENTAQAANVNKTDANA